MDELDILVFVSWLEKEGIYLSGYVQNPHCSVDFNLRPLHGPDLGKVIANFLAHVNDQPEPFPESN